MQASNASEAAAKKPRHLPEVRCDDSPEADFTAAAAKQLHWLPQSEDPSFSPREAPAVTDNLSQPVTLPSQPRVAAAASSQVPGKDDAFEAAMLADAGTSAKHTAAQPLEGVSGMLKL